MSRATLCFCFPDSIIEQFYVSNLLSESDQKKFAQKSAVFLLVVSCCIVYFPGKSYNSHADMNAAETYVQVQRVLQD